MRKLLVATLVAVVVPSVAWASISVPEPGGLSMILMAVAAGAAAHWLRKR